MDLVLLALAVPSVLALALGYAAWRRRNRPAAPRVPDIYPHW